MGRSNGRAIEVVSMTDEQQWTPPGESGPPPIPPNQWAAPPVVAVDVRRRRHRRAIAGTAAAALAIGSAAVVIDRSRPATTGPASAASTQSNPLTQNGQLPQGQTPRYRWGYPGGTAGGTGTSASTSTATDAQQVGVVDINTVLDFGAGQAAGTGIVLTAAGEILTNNHVIADSTGISVTVVSTGRTYAATVVGTDATDDVAVLQLTGASGLATAKIGNSARVAVQDAVTAVGNAGGTGGAPSSATGTVTALNQSITATDETGSNPEQLTGMIEIAADVQAGDSGGPLYAADGTVIGIDTAAGSAPASATSATSATTTAFAIPIAKATSIADAIVAGKASSTIRLGYPAFLGVQLQPGSLDAVSGGAAIAGVVAGSAAATAGLQAGDTITAINGVPVASSSGLSTALASHRPGQRVTVRWLDAAGQPHTATVTLTAGPAA
jgi:S1-C subfamily serine protease